MVSMSEISLDLCELDVAHKNEGSHEVIVARLTILFAE